MSACGSSGSTAVSATGKHAGRDEVVVHALLPLVETGVQKRVRGLLLTHHLHGVPVGTECGQDLGLPLDLLGGEVDGELDRPGGGVAGERGVLWGHGRE